MRLRLPQPSPRPMGLQPMRQRLSPHGLRAGFLTQAALDGVI